MMVLFPTSVRMYRNMSFSGPLKSKYCLSTGHCPWGIAADDSIRCIYRQKKNTPFEKHTELSEIQRWWETVSCYRLNNFCRHATANLATHRATFPVCDALQPPEIGRA